VVELEWLGWCWEGWDD